MFASSKPKIRYGSKPFGIHLKMSSLDFPMRIGNVSSVLLMYGSFKSILMGYSPMQTMACFGNNGFKASICFLTLSRTLKVLLPSFIRGTYIRFKKS